MTRRFLEVMPWVTDFIILMAIVGGQQLVVWQVNRETLVNREVGKVMQGQLDRVENKTSDRWSKSDHNRYIIELKRLNPELKLPKEP